MRRIPLYFPGIGITSIFLASIHSHTFFLPRQFHTLFQSSGNIGDIYCSPSILEKVELSTGKALVVYALGYCGMKIHSDQKVEL